MTENTKTAVATTATAPKAKKQPTKTAKATSELNGHAPKKPDLRKPQVRVLGYLAKQSVPCSRKEIAEGAEVDGPMLNSYIGSHDPEIRAANDAKNFPCLLTLGFVRAQRHEDEPVTYLITAAGRKAYERATK